MQIHCDSKMPQVDIKKLDNEYYIYIYLNERIVEVEYSGQEKPYSCYEYDYNEIRCGLNDIDIQDVTASPNKYLDWAPPKKLTLEEEVAMLKEENQMLTECVLEMSTVVYQ